MRWRLWKVSPWRKLLFRGLAAAMVAAVMATAGCFAVSSQAQRDFRPVNEPLTPEQSAFAAETPKYLRPESATYLTFPEWYLVFNPQDYGQFLHTHPPSEFPYFTSIGQLWNGYAQVAGIANRHYPIDYGNHLMLAVIGTSSTGEWIIKGVYENSVGRIFEWVGGGAHTPEDAYAADVATDYGNFVPTRPWFEYPYGHAFTGLWSKTDFFGPHFLRKGERKFFLSVEYGVKFLYAGVIRLASHAVYGVADTEVYLSAREIPEAAFAIPGVKKIRTLSDGLSVITVPHYQGFTDTLPLLARQGVQFSEVAGNDEMLVTFIAPAAWTYNLSAGHPLFTMELLGGQPLKRVAIQAPVKSLGNILREIEAQGLRLEHLFDY
jgi:hypothetical protein